MKIERYIPSDYLKPFVKTFVIIESEDETKNRILPDTSIVLALRYKGNVSYTEQNNKYSLPSSVITGLRSSSRLMNYSSKAANLLVIFREGAAASFFKQPLNELFSVSIALDNFIPSHKLKQVEEQLNEADNNYKRIQKTEDFLISLLSEGHTDFIVKHAIQKIRIANGNISIKNLADSLSLSQDPFEKRFRRVVGISPKKFSSIIRLRKLIDHHSPTESLTIIALKAGYFDQAHFNKDFRLFTGQAPQEFFKSPTWW